MRVTIINFPQGKRWFKPISSLNQELQKFSCFHPGTPFDVWITTKMVTWPLMTCVVSSLHKERAFPSKKFTTLLSTYRQLEIAIRVCRNLLRFIQPRCRQIHVPISIYYSNRKLNNINHVSGIYHFYTNCRLLPCWSGNRMTTELKMSVDCEWVIFLFLWNFKIRVSVRVRGEDHVWTTCFSRFFVFT